MKCTMCGHEVAQDEKYCSHCGENNEQYVDGKSSSRREENTNKYPASNRLSGYSMPPLQDNTPSSDRVANAFEAIVSFLFPIIGWILYFAYRQNYPTAAKHCAVSAWIGFFIGLVIAFA